MAEYFREPQSPLKKIDKTTGDVTYVYPLTTDKQIIMENGERLNTILNERILYMDETAEESVAEVINADTFGGLPPEAYVFKTENIAAEKVAMESGMSLEQVLAGCWISFIDENNNPTNEPYIHWYADSETGNPVVSGLPNAEENEF